MSRSYCNVFAGVNFFGICERIWHDTYINVLMPVEVDVGGGVVDEDGGALDVWLGGTFPLDDEGS